MPDASVKPDILEVTLRDGSYLIDFQFTARDTAMIACALERVGFRWIEVGHGLGLNASRSGRGTAAASDEQYLEAASQALKSSRWGMFFIPEIGREEDLRLLARYNAHFVRIGTNVTEIDQAERCIKVAKDLGLWVCYNGMKAYAVSPEQWGAGAAQAHAWGADLVYLVDSAGSMDPEEVSSYLKAAQAQSDVPLGFHGHDNLSLAMANTLRAVEQGAMLVDSSLQGMGRSAGNAITEVLVAILQKRGLLPGVDMNAVMDIGAALIRPLLGRRGVDPLAVTGGFAKFHSSFTPKVVRYANKYGVDARDLIVQLCKEDLVSAPDEVLERLAQELSERKTARPISIPAFQTMEVAQRRGASALEVLLAELRPQAVKAEKFSAVNAVIGERPLAEVEVSGNIQHTQAHVVGSVAYTTDEQLCEIARQVDGRADVLLLDVDCKPFGPSAPASDAAKLLKRTTLLTYLDSRVWVAAVEDQAARVLSENLQQVAVVIVGDHPKSRLLATRLAERRANVTLIAEIGNAGVLGSWDAAGAGTTEARERTTSARLVVVWSSGESLMDRRMASLLRADAVVLDATMGAFPMDIHEELQRRGIQVLRLNMWPALAGALAAAHESARVYRESMGQTLLGGVRAVAGGAMGEQGDVIVDSVSNPTRVLGIADGRGGILFDYTPRDADRVRTVLEEIHSRIVAPHFTASV